MLHLTFSEKQDLLLLVGTEIENLTNKLDKLPKTSNKISVNDQLFLLPKLIHRYNDLWAKINTCPVS